MKKLIYILTFILAAIACEEVYNPDLDTVDNMLVVEAILVSGKEQNDIYLNKSIGFNSDKKIYPAVSGATVYITDDNGNSIFCEEQQDSGTYRLNYRLETEQSYFLTIELDGETYVSEMQSVPETPNLDSIYGEFDYKVTTTGASNSTDDIVTEYGIQLYADMDYKGKLNHYRFYGRKIIQFYDDYDTIIPPSREPETRTIYGWKSIYPSGVFNIAGPPEYSAEKNITKHSLEFFVDDYYKFIADTQLFAGWIYMVYQYGINEDTYNYYSDLNSQLDAEGKIFDPVYVQAKGNLTCTSDPEVVVLGNFEISSYAERRYFLNYRTGGEQFTLRSIPWFYNIPGSGYLKDIKPEFWESIYKNYPDD